MVTAWTMERIPEDAIPVYHNSAEKINNIKNM